MSTAKILFRYRKIYLVAHKRKMNFAVRTASLRNSKKHGIILLIGLIR